MYGDIFKFAEKLKKRFRTNNPFEIAEALGIVVSYNSKFKELKGMYFISERIPFIYLNEYLDEQIPLFQRSSDPQGYGAKMPKIVPRCYSKSKGVCLFNFQGAVRILY